MDTIRNPQLVYFLAENRNEKLSDTTLIYELLSQRKTLVFCLDWVSQAFLFWRLYGAIIGPEIRLMLDFISLKMNFGCENSKVINDFSLRITAALNNSCP